MHQYMSPKSGARQGSKAPSKAPARTGKALGSGSQPAPVMRMTLSSTAANEPIQRMEVPEPIGEEEEGMDG